MTKIVKNKILLMFINPHRKEVTVHKNSKLGEFYTVQESEINEVNTSKNCEPKQGPEPKVHLSKADKTDLQKQQLRSLINDSGIVLQMISAS